jgi:predicted RNA-binding Zn ribbon-like protein
MRVNPYTEPLLQNVTDLFNRPASTPAELQDRWTARAMPTDHDAGAEDLRHVREFLRQWTMLVEARRYTTSPSITNHDGSGWHLHYRAHDAGFAATLAGATSAAAAQYLTDRGLHRIRRCARADCANAFVDFTRPGTQKYCSHPCANRDAVRRHRASSRRSG